MSGMTNRGKYNLLNRYYAGAAFPASFYLALFTAAVTPTADTNTKGELAEIPAGNGYVTGGVQISRNTTDWDVRTEDDVNDRALVQLRDIVFTATGGPIPASGSGARWMCLTDDNATQASREVEAYWDLGADRTVSDTQTLTIQDAEIRLTE